MLQFTEYLKEVFDKPYPFKITSQHKDYVVYEFKTVSNEKGLVYFSSDTPGEWDISFEVNYTMDVTGSGDAFAIFATVLKTIEDFIKKVQPTKMFFLAAKVEEDQEKDKTSRISLYNRMISKMAGPAGYDFKTKSSVEGTAYFLTKKS